MGEAPNRESVGGESLADPEVGHTSRVRPLSAISLAAIIFFDVAGSPAGSEDAVVAAGPLLALLGFIIMPLVWSVPEALITAELATMYPEDCGFVAWVSAAFGEYAGFMEGVLSWSAGVVDTAIYPLFILNYCRTIVPALENEGAYHVVLFICIGLLTILNYFGLKFVGWTSVVLLFMILLPFGVLTLLAIPKIDPGRWGEVPPRDEINWKLYLNTLFWNLNYFDSASTVAAEVDNPSKTFPKALTWAVILLVTMYIVVLGAATGVTSDNLNWDSEQLTEVGSVVAGQWLKDWVVFSISLSSIGLFEADLSASSYLLLGMAERGMIPAIFAHRSPHGTPTFSIALSVVAVGGCVLLDVEKLIEMLNLLYIWAAVAEFLAFIYLRVHSPNIARPYQIPLSTRGCVLMLVPTFFFTALLVILATWVSHVVVLVVFVLGSLLFRGVQHTRRHAVFHFHPFQPFDRPLDEARVNDDALRLARSTVNSGQIEMSDSAAITRTTA